MAAATRLGDICTGHSCWPPRASASASPNVFVNGKAWHREGDSWEPHTCPDIPETHASTLAGGSSTVFINGKRAGRVGDPVACGSSVAEGSPDVFVGG
jgi:uncharacterized Zn-binding protein involved in type VI secretion